MNGSSHSAGYSARPVLQVFRGEGRTKRAAEHAAASAALAFIDSLGMLARQPPPQPAPRLGSGGPVTEEEVRRQQFGLAAMAEQDADSGHHALSVRVDMRQKTARGGAHPVHVQPACCAQVRMLQQKLAGLGQPAVTKPIEMRGADGLRLAASSSTASPPTPTSDGYLSGERPTPRMSFSSSIRCPSWWRSQASDFTRPTHSERWPS